MKSATSNMYGDALGTKFCQLLKCPSPSLNRTKTPRLFHGATLYKVVFLTMSRSPSPSMSWICPAVPNALCSNSPTRASPSSVKCPVPSLMSRKSLAVPPPLLTR